MSDSGITAEEFKAWLKPLTIWELLRNSSAVSSSLILEALSGGVLASAAARASFQSPDKHDAIQDLFCIPAWMWRHRVMDDLLGLGFAQFSFPESPGDPHTILRCFNVRICPVGLQEAFPHLVHSIAATAPTTHAERSSKVPAAGRLRKEFWDDLIIAVCKRIWDGDLQPTCQADVERAMLDWASEHGHSLGTTSVKAPAKKVFLALSK